MSLDERDMALDTVKGAAPRLLASFGRETFKRTKVRGEAYEHFVVLGDIHSINT